MNVKLIRMMSGEDVIADLVYEGGDTLTIANPIVLVPQGGTVGFAPWSPVLSPDVKELTIKESYTVYISVPNDEVIKNYNEIFSPIVQPNPSAKKLIV